MFQIKSVKNDILKKIGMPIDSSQISGISMREIPGLQKLTVKNCSICKLEKALQVNATLRSSPASEIPIFEDISPALE